MKKAQGITLIALVVTIVTMLILAAVSINLSFGDNGIFNQTGSAASKHRYETAKERVDIEMAGLTLEAIQTGKPLTTQRVADHFNSLDWIEDAREESEDTVRIITDEFFVFDVKIEGYDYQIIEQGRDDGEPYPTIQAEQMPMQGTAGEKIKVKVTASVEIKGETTGIDNIENVTTGEIKGYEEGGVIFELTDNGEYTFKATTNKGKTKLVKINVNVVSGGIIGITVQPTTPRNTIQEGTQNGVATGPIVVSISYGEINLTNTDRYQYRIGRDGTWQVASNNQIQVNVTENTIVVARYYDGYNSIGVQNYTVQNVDNVAPSSVTGTISETSTNSLTITASASDTASSGAGSDIPGILRYEYSMNGNDWQSENTIQGLNHNTEYTIHIKAIDKAGNEATSTIQGKTDEVPGGSAIGFNASTTTWTKGPVTIEITWPSNITGLSQKYKIGSGDWQNYTGTFNVSSNTTIYAMLEDGNGQSGTTAEYAITWIDTVVPNAPSLTITSGTAGSNGWYRSNITVTITNGIDGLGQVDRSTYVISGAQTLGETAGNSITISAEGTSTITAYTYDKAGNRSQAASITVKKDSVGPTISGLTSITVSSYTAATFTSGVSVTDGTSGMSGTFSYSPSTLAEGSNTITYTARDNAGNTTTATRNIILDSPKYLVDKVAVGDYVAYDAGTWPSEAVLPFPYQEFKVNQPGSNRGTSIQMYSNRSYTSGWRVLYKSGSGSSGVVTLISAGCPVMKYFAFEERFDALTGATLLNNFANAYFVNSTYAASARSATEADVSSLDNSIGGLRNIVASYWLADWGQSSGGPYLKYVWVEDGSIQYALGNNVSLGVRPVVTLKPGVMTNASKDTSFLGQTCWAVK